MTHWSASASSRASARTGGAEGAESRPEAASRGSAAASAILPRLLLPPARFRAGASELPDMKTISAKADGVKRDWYVIDATNKTLGRLCSELAHRLRGKHKPIFTPHVDTGDY